MTLGRAGEKAAAAFLKRCGWRIAARNYTCPQGELDLVGIDGDTIVFVEVKARRSDASADPEANITYHKQRRITRAARHYLMEKDVADRPCRFDVIAIVLPERGEPQVEHFVDAFGPVPR